MPRLPRLARTPPPPPPPPLPPGALVRPILEYPSPALRAKCAPLPFPLSAPARALLRDLPPTLAAHRGMGLAAPQLGELLRVFIMRTPLAWTAAGAARARAALAPGGGPRAEGVTLCVNPQLLHRSEGSALGMESCLSMPGDPLLVWRSERVGVAWQDEAGARVEAELEGLPAVVFQHELDHLDGVLITDREVKVPARERDAAMMRASALFREAHRRFYGGKL